MVKENLKRHAINYLSFYREQFTKVLTSKHTLNKEFEIYLLLDKVSYPRFNKRQEKTITKYIFNILSK